jgi:O-methyltransferase domain/Dimerisation domain
MANESSLRPDLSAEAQMNTLRFGLVTTQAIAVAARLGLADLVAEAPQTVEELARETKTHAPSLHRLLQFLASLAIFEEDAAGKYRQTVLSETLRNDAPRTLRAATIFLGADFIWKPWGDLWQTIVTGQPAFERMLGAPPFEYLVAHPEEAAIGAAAMTSASSVQVSDILAAYDFSRFERIVDVGGGQGLLLHGILSAHPQLQGVLADRPSVVAGATALRIKPIADRCEVVGIDFFQSVPEGADAYVAKSVIHDWNDYDAVRILKNCRRAIRKDGTMLLIELILKPANQPDFARFADMQMLVVTGGQERTEAEYRALLGEAGLSLTRVIPTAGFMSIIESQPV